MGTQVSRLGRLFVVIASELAHVLGGRGDDDGDVVKKVWRYWETQKARLGRRR